MLAGEAASTATERVLVLTGAEQSFTFVDVDEAAVPSLLRGFSAPVRLDDGLDDAALLALLRHDADAFNRWEASQRLAMGRLAAALATGSLPQADDAWLQALREVLHHPTLDAGLKAQILELPSEDLLADLMRPLDPQRLHAAREHLRAQLAERLQADWATAFEAHQVRAGYAPTPDQAGQRALANLALAMLTLHAVRTGDAAVQGRTYQRFKDAGNMTDRIGALAALVDAHAALAETALAQFLETFRDDALVVDKWFALQARAPEQDGRVFARVKALLQHPAFSLRNPNRARALLQAYCMQNPAAFHRADAGGYVLWAERVTELDAINPNLASRLARAMDRWADLAEPYRGAAREAIARVAARPGLSDDLREIVNKAIASDDSA